ncbi:MAG: glutathione S-transferase family protein [Pseudomonadota bacterium]
MLQLYHHGSSVCAAKVRLALAEKGIVWEGHYVDILAGVQFEESYLKINPRAMVPAIVHDGRTIIESTLICEYLEETFPERPIYPSDAYERYEARLWTKAVDEELHPACSALTYVVSHRHTIMRNGLGSFEDFLKTPSNETKEARTLKWQWLQHGLDAPGAADKVKLYVRHMRKMEESLTNGPWLVGRSFSIADVAMAPYVNRLAMLQLGEIWEGGRLPRVEDWFARLRARPTFKPALLDWIPDGLEHDLTSNGAKSLPDVRRILAA